MADYTATMAAGIHTREAFAELVEEHRRIVFKVANMYCWRPDDRADLKQEILVQLWRAFPKYDASRLFSTWMYRIALNVAISSVRRRQREAPTVPFDEAVHDTADHGRSTPDGDERVRALYRVIEGLDPMNRALLLLCLDEHSYREIAEILGISETNVSTKLNRLKARIREDIGETTT